MKNSEDHLETIDTERNTKLVRVPHKKYLDSEPDELNHGKQSKKALKLQEGKFIHHQLHHLK